jgi:hypothetical protein
LAVPILPLLLFFFFVLLFARLAVVVTVLLLLLPLMAPFSSWSCSVLVINRTHRRILRTWIWLIFFVLPF